MGLFRDCFIESMKMIRRSFCAVSNDSIVIDNEMKDYLGSTSFWSSSCLVFFRCAEDMLLRGLFVTRSETQPLINPSREIKKVCLPNVSLQSGFMHCTRRFSRSTSVTL